MSPAADRWFATVPVGIAGRRVVNYPTVTRAVRQRAGPPAVGADETATTVPAGQQLRVLYDAHYRSLVKLASFYVDDVPSAEEVVQDAFVSVLSGRRRIGAGREAAYLRAAVLNGARSQLRRRRVRRWHQPEPDPPAPAAERDGIQRTVRDEVLAALRQLPPRQSAVLVLRYYLELSEAEIADTLGVSAGSVKSHAHRGLARLRQLLEEVR